MIKLYIKQAFYQLRENRLISLVSIIGTALAICMIMVIVLVLEVRITDCVPEVNRSRSLYMKAMSIHQKGDTSDNSSNGCMSLTVAKECFKALTVPEAVTIVSTGGRMRISVPAGKMMTVDNLETDDTFWKVFSFDFIAGKPFTAADSESGLPKVVLSASVARNLFGTVEAVGRTVQLNLADYTVVGVVKDVSKLAVSSYAQIWIPFNSTEIARKCWYDNAMGTFRVVILAHSEKDFPAIREEAERLRQKFNDGLQDSEIFYRGQPDDRFSFIFRHWGRELQAKEAYLHYLLVIVILLLVPAINLSSMTLSRMRKRMSEIGVRKAFGATANVLLRQVFYENLLLTLIAGAVGMLFSYACTFLLNDFLFSNSENRAQIGETSLSADMLNERRSNAFLWMELFVVFVILWYIVDVVYVTLSIYNLPMGFDIENTYVLRFERMTSKAAAYQPGRTMKEDVADLHEIVNRLAHRPDVEAVSLSQNCIPYNDGANSFSFYLDTVPVRSLKRWITPEYFNVFRYRNIDGSGSESLAEALTPSGMVLSVNIADVYQDAPWHGKELLGRRVPVWRNEPEAEHLSIAALTEPVRYDHFTAPDDYGSRYAAVYLTDEALESLGETVYIEVCLRVREGQNDGFIDRLIVDADRQYQVGNLYLLDITPLSDVRTAYETDSVNELNTQFCIIFFLLLNIFLGIFGTFWFRTQHRRAEIALRMALGSTRWGICGRLMGEGVLLLLISVIPALVVAWNLGYAELVEVTRMPFTAGRFTITVLGTFILIAGMIVIGIGYPARRAMSIEPAEALHEE